MLDIAAFENDRSYMEKNSRHVVVDFSNAKNDVPDMVLGMDVLRHLHIYLSLKEKRMYFSAGAPAPVPPTPAAVAK